jgi:hypothetical protein
MKTWDKKSVIAFFLCFLSVSCVNSTNDQLFLKKDNIIFKNMHVEEKLGRVLAIKSVNNYLAVIEKSIDTQVQLIDKETRESYQFGQTGEGPGRLLQSLNIIPLDDAHIGIYDTQKRTLFQFNIDSIVRLKASCLPEILIKEVPSFPLAVDKINEHTYVALGLMSGTKRFTLFNNNGEVVSTEGALPEKPQEQISDFVHAFAYWGRLTTNLKENKVAICTNYAGMMQLYDCRTSEVRLIKEHLLFLADYTERDGNFAPTAQTRWGYLSIDSNDKYIFALYSGLNQTENPETFYKGSLIHVYDWDGNPVCLLQSDRQLSMICVDNEFNLYGYDSAQEDIVTVNVGKNLP